MLSTNRWVRRALRLTKQVGIDWEEKETGSHEKLVENSGLTTARGKLGLGITGGSRQTLHNLGSYQVTTNPQPSHQGFATSICDNSE